MLETLKQAVAEALKRKRRLDSMLWSGAMTRPGSTRTDRTR